MKKISIRAISTVLCLSILTVPSLAFSEDYVNTADQIKEEYGLQSISSSDVPDGITPLEFDSPEEAALFLENLEKIQKNRSSDEYIQESNTLQIVPSATVYTGTLSKTVPNTDFLNLWEGKGFVKFTYEYNSAGEARFVDCLDFSADFVGITTFVRFTMQQWYYNIKNLNKDLEVTFTGTTDIYISWPGDIVLDTIDATSTVTYYSSEI